ncbi:hypothetical protein HMF7854_03940 [Sphingomonas ginkgonis]|uniref:PAS domain-containing protein n=1 Tax=Sphingomonas ginkgonis TaxID=2315330 RepID=A0A429V7Y2_9SPHN|nr:hypothetical protein [Sphingomonas ginkgonis]RST30070.1 hypothetical protein HMF7854_03940 [Sphingomonas ginkgonis]
MDGYSQHGEFDSDALDLAPAAPVSPVGDDERRMHVRAYNHWVSLLGGRDFPSIEDLDPGNIEDFASHSVLLDFTSGGEDPETAYIGQAIREEGGLGPTVRTIADVPSRSLLSRLTDHYLQIIANRAPIGFEAEFDNQRGDTIFYRGILMPFSSDGDTIDFIYGVINWKTGGEQRAALAARPLAAPALELTDLHAAPGREEEELLELEQPLLDEDAGLADRLHAARETAETLKALDGRSRVALYRALAMAWDFTVAARRVPDEYASILEDAGVKAQARAPMTPIVKLVFGADYDKTRLTEFAAALSHAERCAVDFGGFQAFVEACPGGLKGLVAAERQARRPAARGDDRGEQARAALREAAPIALETALGDREFALVLLRRGEDGAVAAVAALADEAMLEKALRKVV